MSEEYDFAEFRQLAQAVGYTTILWSDMERQLDNWVIISYKRCGGNKIQDEIPRAFMKKCGYLKKAFLGLPKLAAFRDESQKILERAKALSGVRHTLTHATLESMLPENGVFTYRHLIHGRQTYSVEMKTFDLKDWPPIFLELQALSHESAMLAKRLLETFPPPKR